MADNIRTITEPQILPTAPRQVGIDYTQSEIAPQTQMAQQLRDQADQIKQSRQWLYDQVNMGYELSNKDFNTLAGILQNSTDWDTDINKFQQALMYSQHEDVPLDFAYQNLEALNEAYTGRKPSYTKSATRAILDSMEIGKLSMLKSEIGLKFLEAEDKGEDTTEYVNQIKAIEADMEKLQDNAPRRLLTKLLKVTAQSVPYTVDIAFKAAAAGIGGMAGASLFATPALGTVGKLIGAVQDGVAMGAGASIAPEATTALMLADAAYSKAATAGAWIQSARLSSGAVYYDLRQKGVEKEVAWPVALMNGVVQGAIETSLGVIPAMGQAARVAMGFPAASLSAKVFAGLYAKGTLGAIAAGVTNYVKVAGGEGLEEYLQSLADNLAEYTALTVSTETSYTFDKSTMDVFKEAFHEGLAGFGSALILGGIPAIINTNADVNYARQLKLEAEGMPSKNMFIKRHMDDQQFSGLADNERKAALEKIYAQNHTTEGVSNTDAETIDTDYIPVNETDLEEGQEAQASELPGRPLKRREDSRLHTQQATTYHENADGTETHYLKLGSTDSNYRYGTIKYTIGKDGKTINIDWVRMKPGQDKYTGEFVTELMRRYEGYDFTWEPGKSQIQIKEQLLKESPDGTLQRFKGNADMDEDLEVGGFIREHMPGITADQAPVAAEFLRFAARKQGKSVHEFLTDNIQFKTIQEGVDAGVISAEDARNARGALQRMADATKAIMYVGEKGDFSTFLHEITMHYNVTANPEDGAKVAQALKASVDTPQFSKYLDQHKKILQTTKLPKEQFINEIKTMAENPLEWSENADEIVAVLGETYFQEGKTFNPELKTIFDRIIDFFYKIYRLMKQKVQLSDDVIKAYDNLVAGNPELKKRFEAQEQTETKTETQTQGNTRLQGDIEYLNAVEAGDMAKAQAMVDERANATGYTIKAYHGSPNHGITEFDEGLIYFVKKKSIAEQYRAKKGYFSAHDEASGTIYGAYLRMDNPATLEVGGRYDRINKHYVMALIDPQYSWTIGDDVELIKADEAARIVRDSGLYDGLILKDIADNMYDDDKRRTDEYIVFSPNQIKSADPVTYDANGNVIPLSQRFNKDNKDIRFQGSIPAEVEDSLIQEAKGFDTVDEWLDYNKMMTPEDEYNEDDFRAVWNKAHNITENAEGEPVVDTSEMSDEDKDKAFYTLLQTDEGIRKVIDDMRMSYSFLDDIANRGPEDAEEQARADALYKATSRMEKEAAPIIANLVKGKKEVSDEAVKIVRGIMAKNPTAYRDLYAAVTGNEQLSSNNDALPHIDEPTVPGMENMSIAERRRIADRIENEDLKKKILSGKDTYEGAAQKVIKMLDEDIAGKQKEIDALQEKLDNDLKRISSRDKMLLKAADERAEIEKKVNKISASIRTKLDKDMRISTEEYRRRDSLQERLELIQEQTSELNKQTKLKEIAKRQQAIKDLKAKLREKENERRAAREYINYKKGLVNDIMKKVPKNVNWEQAEKINAIQALLGETTGYSNSNINVNGKKYTIEAFKEAVDKGEIAIEGLTDYQMKRYLNKSLAELTTEELETLHDTVRYLKEQGRQAWQAKVDQRNFEAQQYQNFLLNEIAGNPKYVEAGDVPLPETAESVKKARTFAEMVRTGWYKTLNMARKAQILDGNRKAIAYRLLIGEKRDAQAAEFEAIRKRMRPVLKLMDELGVKPNDFYETHIIKINGKEYSYTLSQLIYGIKAQMEERNREAFVYGNLLTQTEKEFYGHDNDKLKLIGSMRNEEFLEQARKILSKEEKLLKVADAIWADWQNKENFDRLNQVAIDEYNMPVDPVQFYMPIARKDFNGTELSAKIADDLYNKNAGKGMTAVEKGMTKSRLTISPDHQQPVDMDYFKLWTDSVTDQEHFIATNAYVRKLNRIFKAMGSKDLRANIESTFGRAMLEDIDNYINEVANPNIQTDTQGINKLINTIRGMLYPAYLAWKSSSVILQMITSPAPFLREVGPVELAKGILQMSMHPVETWRYITELSPTMENRSMNPLIDEIEEAAKRYTDPKYKQVWHNMQKWGTSGLEMADRWAVAGGWLAVFDKKKAEYLEQGMDEAQAQKKAIKYADDVVLETQPTGDKTELAPLFKSGNAAVQAFTQFQVSLNVIWNNLTYDVLKGDLTAHAARQAMGTLIGYALAGAILYAVQDGFDDDDEAEDKLLKILYGATTQFTSSIPLVSSNLDNFIRSKMTGDAWYSRSSQLYPGLDTLMQGLSTGKLEKILKGTGIMFGAPVSGLREFEEMFYNRKTGETRFYPQALLGRREK